MSFYDDIVVEAFDHQQICLWQAFAQRRNVIFSADDSFVGSIKSLKASAAPVTR